MNPSRVQRSAASFLLLFAVPFAAAGADPSPMQEGLWEISVQVDVPGMPFKLPATTVQHCYTSQELQEQGGVPQQERDCKVTEVKRTASSVSWKVACTGKKNAGTGEGEITFSGARAYEGKMRMTTGGATVATLYKGKRVGDCK